MATNRTSYRNRLNFSSHIPGRRYQDAAIPSEQEDLPLTKEKILDELSVRGTLVYDRSMFFPYNPDDLSSVKIQGSYPAQGMWPKHGPFAIYRQMRVDEQVKACLTYKKLARLSHGWTFTPKDKSLLTRRTCDFIEHCVNDMEGSFHQSLKHIMLALDFGMSVTEINFRYEDSGLFKGLIGLKDLKTRAPETFRINPDEFGNIKSLTQFLPNATPYEVPKDKFILYTYAMEFSGHYGQSDLRSCYRSWWSKNFIIKAWNIYLDRYGQPTRVMKLPPGSAGDTSIADKAMKILDSIQTDTSITLPPGFELDFKQVGTSGTAGYQEALDRYDKSIAKALLYPELGGLTERGAGGSQHMARSQMSGYDLVLMDLGIDLESMVVMDQLVKRLIIINFGPQAPLPLFKLGSMTLRDQDDFVANITKAKQAGTITWGYTDESNLRQALYMPEIDLEVWKKANNTTTEYVPVAPAGGPPAGGAPGAMPGLPGGAPAPAGGESPTPPGTADLMGALGMSAKVETFSDKTDTSKFRPVLLKTKADWDILPPEVAGKKKMSGKTSRLEPRPKSKFERRTDFAAIKRSMDTLENVGVRCFAKIMARAGQDANDFVKSKKLLEDSKRMKEILDFSFSELPIRRLLENLMLAEYLAGKIQVVDGLRKRGAKIPLKFSSSDLDRIDEVFDDYDPNNADVDMNEIIDVIRMPNDYTSIPLQKGELARIKDSFRVKAHAIAGENRTKVLSNVQRMLQKAVDEGWSYDTWKGNLEDSMGDYAGTVFGKYGEGDMDGATHAKTTFRTIMNETMNSGRLEAMRDESLGVIVAGVQYSAILDTATTKICQAADGVCIKLNNPNLISPPLHFSCRSIILEILEDDDDGSIEWADKLPIPPAKGFGTNDFSAKCCKFSDTGVSTRNLDFATIKEPVAIYCHADDMDGLVGGVAMQRLAWVLFGKVVPVIPTSYSGVPFLNPKDPCWVVDLGISNSPLADNIDNLIVDHHQWEDAPEGQYWIDSTETMSAAGMASRLLNEAIDCGVGAMTNVRNMIISSDIYETIEAGDCWKENDPRFDLARDLQYFMNTIGFDAMWIRFANNIENIMIAPELPYMRERRVKDEAAQVVNARQHLVPVSWGVIIDAPANATVATVLSKELNKTVAHLKGSGIGTTVCFKSSNGEALKLARDFGGGGHENSAGAYLDLTKDLVIKKLQEVSYAAMQ